MAGYRHTKKRRNPKGAGSTVKDNKSGIYYYYWHDAYGKQHKRSLRTRNKEEAEKLAQEYIKIINAESKKEVLLYAAELNGHINRKKLPFHNVWDEFKQNKPTAGESTQKGYKRVFDLFVTWLKDYRPSIKDFGELDADTCEEYFSELWRGGISASSYNRYKSALTTITSTLAQKYGLENHWKKIKRRKSPPQERKPLNRQQVNKLFEIIEQDNCLPYPHEMRILIHLAIFSGCRLYDVVCMQWDNIDFNNGLIIYRPQKTRRTSNAEACLPLFPNVRQMLLELDTTSEYLFPQTRAHYLRNNYYIVKKLGEVIIQATGDIRNNPKTQHKHNRRQYSFHSLRATFATECVKTKKVSSIELAKMMGDAIETVSKYYVPSNLQTEKVPEFEKALNDSQKQLLQDPNCSELMRLIPELDNETIKKLLTIAKGKAKND